METDSSHDIDLFMNEDDPLKAFPIRNQMSRYLNELIGKDYMTWTSAVDQILTCCSKYLASTGLPDKRVAGLMLFLHCVLKNGRQYVSRCEEERTLNLETFICNLNVYTKNHRPNVIITMPFLKLLSTLLKWSEFVDEDKIYLDRLAAAVVDIGNKIVPSSKCHLFGRWMNLCSTYFYVSAENDIEINSALVLFIQSRLATLGSIDYPVDVQECTLIEEETPGYNLLKFFELNFCLVKFANTAPVSGFKEMIESPKLNVFLFSQDDPDIVKLCAFLTYCGNQISERFSAFHVFELFCEYAVHDFNDVVEYLISNELSYFRGFDGGFLRLFLHWLKTMASSKFVLKKDCILLLATLNAQLENMTRLGTFPYDIRPLCRRIAEVLETCGQ